MTDVTKLKLYPLTAWDEVSFSRRMARVLALILPDVGDLAAAEALATNCVTVFCAVRGAIDEVDRPALPSDPGRDRPAGGTVCPSPGRLV